MTEKFTQNISFRNGFRNYSHEIVALNTKLKYVYNFIISSIHLTSIYITTIQIWIFILWNYILYFHPIHPQPQKTKYINDYAKGIKNMVWKDSKAFNDKLPLGEKYIGRSCVYILMLRLSLVNILYIFT